MRTLPSACPSPVPPMLTEQTRWDSCDGHWLGRGEGANLVNARGGSKTAWRHLIWAWKTKPGRPFWLCNSQGRREVYRTFSVAVNAVGWLHAL